MRRFSIGSAALLTLGFLVIGTAESSPTQAPTGPILVPAPQVLDPICADFMKAPETFTLLLEPKDKKNLEFDLDGDGKMEKIALQLSRGSCPAHIPCLIGKKSCEPLDYTGIPANSYGFGHHAELYRKDGVLYAVDRLDKEFVSISRLTKNGRELLCEYRERLEKWQPPVEKSKVCQALSINDLRLVKADKPHKLTSRAYTDSPDGENFSMVDLAGTGTRVGLMNMEMLTASGCGCARSYLALINSFGDSLVAAQTSKLVSRENAHLSKALSELTNRAEFCGADQKWSVVELDKKIYLLASPETQPGEWTLGRIRPRELYAWDRQKFIRICTQEPVLSRGAAPAQLQLAPSPE